ncbi:MAG TPA: 16S rRNA (adenine(1518)-N(6)/adenine(1519)-N(6))-dimethyltransferase RsmA [Terriglobales bacterium]|nr:16S rRNA (adenine(1518)-N(6)/adenine(1519)-N(6))-dimethyltransferase RsmA [Terriglobales bacterium]
MAYGKRVKPATNEVGAQQVPATEIVSRAKKSLGQNFLADRGAAQRIIEALGDISQKKVLEIGPGRGALTDLLIPRTPHLIAIELDRVLAAQLRMKYANMNNVEVIEADFLDVDIASLLGPRPGTTVTGLTPQPPDKIRAVGNIPYYITSDILLRIFDCHRFFESVVIMVQQEVADRIVAKPGTSDYGLLSATCQLYARIEKLFTLPPGAFSPPPKVHSSVLRLNIDPKFERLSVEPQPFVDFLKLSFAQKRKTLVNNLKQRYPDKGVRVALEKAKLRSDVRAEALPLERAAAVFRSLKPEPTQD